jgi:hypothetical protein
MSTKDRDQAPYAFAKLKGTNYREWARHMMLALKEAELWRLVSGTKPLPVLDEKVTTDPDKIELKKEQIAEYYMLNEKAVGKIGKMCTNHVQTKFFSIKND